MIKYDINLLRRVRDDFSNWASFIESNSYQIFNACMKMINALEQEIKVVEQQRTMLNNEMNAANNAYKINCETRSKARNTIAQLQREISHVNSQISSLNSQISSAGDSEAASSLKKQKKELNNQLESLREQISELEKKIALIGENNNRLGSLRSIIQDELYKCYNHKLELEDVLKDMESSYNTFKDNIVPNVKSAIYEKIIPSMDEAIEKGTALVKGLLSLAEHEGGNYYSMEVNIDSPASFFNLAAKMEIAVNELDRVSQRCAKATYNFSHNLNDRVSKYASDIVSMTKYDIDQKYFYFKNQVFKIREVNRLCKEYEEVIVY